jgi:hypothetical protein
VSSMGVIQIDKCWPRVARRRAINGVMLVSAPLERHETRLHQGWADLASTSSATVIWTQGRHQRRLSRAYNHGRSTNGVMYQMSNTHQPVTPKTLAPKRSGKLASILTR